VLGDSRWEDTVGLGLIKLFRRSSLGGNASYARLTNGVGSASVNGYSMSAFYGHSLHRALELELAYIQTQFFSVTSRKSSFVTLSFVWHPHMIPLGD